MFHPSYRTIKNHENTIAREQAPTGERTLRQLLNTEYTALSMKARAVRGSRKPADVAMCKRAEASMADLAEQLVILDAIEFGFIVPLVPEWAT